jgi:hypothetical protein
MASPNENLCRKGIAMSQDALDGHGFGSGEALRGFLSSMEVYLAQREWSYEKRRRTYAVRRAIESVRHARGPAKTEALSNAVDKISYRLGAESSEARLPVLLRLAESAPTSLFWYALLDQWSSCDDTWGHMPRLLVALRFHARKQSPHAYLDDVGLTLLDGLPSVVTVYRGCSRTRLHGISWTTDEAVAHGFAIGHRGLRVPDPVVVKAAIAKQDIFAVVTDRSESEILLDPAKIERVRVLSQSAQT